jgi:hypothetical protein
MLPTVNLRRAFTVTLKNSSAIRQFRYKIFPQGIKEDILDQTVDEVIMPSFGGSFGLAHANPVGGFVAGSLKPFFFHKCFEKIDGLPIDGHPVGGNSSGIHGQ